MKNEKCIKCRWLFPNIGYGDLTTKKSEILGNCSNPYIEDTEIIPSDITTEYDKCIDFAPFAEFEDEELEKSLLDNHSEVMDFE